jgi:hypothetical protein
LINVDRKSSKSAPLDCHYQNEMLPMKPILERSDFDAKRPQNRPGRLVGKALPARLARARKRHYTFAGRFRPNPRGGSVRCKVLFQGIDSSSKFR